MITVEYDQNGDAINDFILEKVYQVFLNDYTDTYHYVFSTENIIYRIRLGILTKEVWFPIQFMFNKEIIGVNEFGIINNYPKGFCNCVSGINEKIVMAMLHGG